MCQVFKIEILNYLGISEIHVYKMFLLSVKGQ